MISSCHYYHPGSRLWLALRFHALPLQCITRNKSTETASIVTEQKRVIYANHAAQLAGVRYGFDETTAQLVSDCEVHICDREKEAQVLADLSAQLYQFTPYIETYICQTEPHAGLLLEISSCLKLFAGVKNLAAKISTWLDATPYAFVIGFAATAKGAWLLSFQQHVITGDETKELFNTRLKSLPIQLLHDFPEVVDALAKTGFKTLGDLTRQIDAQKISSIKKRFGQKFTQTLCDIFAIEHNLQQNLLFDKPLPVYKPIETFSENIQFDYPISQSDQLHHPIEYLLQNLSHYLRKRQLECQHIEWKLFDIYRNHFILHVHSDSAESHWELLYDLTLIQLDNRELPFEVDSLTLTCINANPSQNRSQTFAFDNSRKSRSGARSFAITIAKLKARLGDAAIFKLTYSDALLPEVSNKLISLTENCNQHLPDVHKKSMRPAWLLPSPVLIDVRKQGLYWRGQLTLLAGPERIRSSWWNELSARDYFVAQRHDHVRLWIFLDLHKKIWYVHGIFG